MRPEAGITLLVVFAFVVRFLVLTQRSMAAQERIAIALEEIAEQLRKRDR